MTLTGPPDLLVSSVHRDIKVSPLSPLSKSLQEECNSFDFSTLEDTNSKASKRHCRTFEYKSLPKQKNYSMHSPKKRTDRHGTKPDIVWNAQGHQQRYRFSAPDIFSHRVPSQPMDEDHQPAVHIQIRKNRSKSAPWVETSLTPASFQSPSSARKGRESRWTAHWRPEISLSKESRYAPNRKHLHDVYPVRLPPQMTDNRHSPHYSADNYAEALLDKPPTSHHVRCRVDIKPNNSALHHHPRQKQPISSMDIPWQRYHNEGGRSLTVPRHFSYSRTPTPTDSLGRESRQTTQYSCSLPNKYNHIVEGPFEMMLPSSYQRENRAHSSPNMPTQFFYEDDPGRYVTTVPPQPSSYLYDPYTPGQTSKVQSVHDKRGQTAPSMGTRPSYPEMEHYPYTVQLTYPKSYSTNDPGPYIIQPLPAKTFYGDDPRSYQVQTGPPRFYYPSDLHAMPPQHHVPARAYYTESQKSARVIPPQTDDGYVSYAPGYSSNPVSYVTHVTPTRVKQESLLMPWYSNISAEPQRIDTDSKSYSRSLDDIINSRTEREQPPSVQRRQSYDDLAPRKPARTSDDKPQPVVVNLSTSPRRYAALSMSDNSLIDQSPPQTSKNYTSKQWVVTPEITITDNDFRTGNLQNTEGRSASWDILDSRGSEGPELGQRDMKGSTKDKPYDSGSLQQSLEQLDELLADLVTDYKPPSRRASEDILDQLKKLIDEEEAVSLSRKCSVAVTEGPPPLDKQPTSIRVNPDSFQDMDGASDAMKSADECSPDQSPDEDDTMMCSNNRCRRTETLFNACLYFKSCHSCYTYYCSRNCRREDWDIHKESCVYGRIGSSCRHIIKHCRETIEVHKAFSRLAKVGYLSRGRGVLFLGFPNTMSSSNFLQSGLNSLPMSPTYLSLRELESFQDNLGDYCKELQEAGKEYDPNECFILNVSIAVGEQLPDGPSPRNQAPAVRKYAKVALASFSPDRKVYKKEAEMETLILTPPPGTTDIDKAGEEGRKAREICFINIQRELRIRGVFLRHEYPNVYQQLCEFVENNLRFTPTTIYPIDKRTGKQFMCMIMAASEPRTLDWVGTPHLLDDII